MAPLPLSSQPRAFSEKRKIPISAQIRHCEAELNQLTGVDRIGAARMKRTRNEADVLAERQRAVIESLKWLRDNRDAFLAWKAATKSAEGAGEPA